MSISFWASHIMNSCLFEVDLLAPHKIEENAKNGSDHAATTAFVK